MKNYKINHLYLAVSVFQLLFLVCSCSNLGKDTNEHISQNEAPTTTSESLDRNDTKNSHQNPPPGSFNVLADTLDGTFSVNDYMHTKYPEITPSDILESKTNGIANSYGMILYEKKLYAKVLSALIEEAELMGIAAEEDLWHVYINDNVRKQHRLMA